MIVLREHQILPIQFIKDNFGLIIYHSLGTGKTITSLMGMNQFKKEVVIIGPKSSKKIFMDEIDKLKLDKDKFKIFSYKKIIKILYDKIEYLQDKCVIVDEAHHLRSETRDNSFIVDALGLSFRVFLLTATPIVNYLNDIAVLVNIVKKSNVLPRERNLFNFLYFNEERLELINEDILLGKIKSTLSYYERNDDPNYPKTTVIIKKVQMNKEQILEYGKFVIKFLKQKESLFDENMRVRVNVLKVKFDLLSTKARNAFLTASRQISNTIDGREDFPKIQAIFSKLTEGEFPKVVYSNFLKNGIYPLVKLLNKTDFSYRIITGQTSQDKIGEIVDKYNKGQVNILLLSSAGSESLDLKNTRQIHVEEPHWNDAKIQQVIGRAIRYKSHEALPPENRLVEIYKWVAVFPKALESKSADEYLIEISNKKEKIFSEFKKILIKASIERNWLRQTAGHFKKKYIKYKKKYMNLRI